MEYANVAVRFDTPVLMNRDGDIVENEEDAFGCRVTHNVTRPDMILCMDEVGSSTCQKGDGAVGGEKYVCERSKTPRQKCSTKAKHWKTVSSNEFRALMSCLNY